MATVTIPTGNYPKMVTVAGAGGGLVPAVWIAGNAKQFNLIILNSSDDEKAFSPANAAAPLSGVVSGYGGSWENRHGGRG